MSGNRSSVYRLSLQAKLIALPSLLIQISSQVLLRGRNHLPNQKNLRGKYINALQPIQRQRWHPHRLGGVTRGRRGASGDTAAPADSAKFLSFLQLLKKTLPGGARITAATQSVTFAGPDGNPMDDVSAFAQVLDWILLMNYDVWGCGFFFFPPYLHFPLLDMFKT